MSKPAYWPVVLFISTCLFPVPVTAQSDAEVQELRRLLAQREAEITVLQQQLETLQLQSRGASEGHDRPAGRTVPDSQPTGAVMIGTTAATSSGSSTASEDDITTALESALVRQGGSVLSPGTIEFEPELSYFYDEMSTGARRDGFGTAISMRFGLPHSMQADVYLPYVIRDDISGADRSSGIGDVRLGLTKELVKERNGAPTLLVFGRWRTTTGDIDRTPPTGFGQHGIQVGLTATKRMDPALLFGSVSYTSNLGTARLRSGARIDAGNVFGARLGANLAATPDTSFYWGVSYNSSSADRFNDERVEISNRALGYLELGSTTIISRAKFVNVGVGIGVTSAAPKFFITASLPIRF